LRARGNVPAATFESNLAFFLVVMNCFFYVGALNETLGYGNRVAKFLFKAAHSKADIQFELNHDFAHSESVSSRRSGRSAPRSERRASNPDPQNRVVIAEFSHVTVKNPANITLIQNLSMQVLMQKRALTKYTILFGRLCSVPSPTPEFCADIQRARMSYLRSFGLRQIVIITCHRPIVARC
jgi:hypothetical protein